MVVINRNVGNREKSDFNIDVKIRMVKLEERKKDSLIAAFFSSTASFHCLSVPYIAVIYASTFRLEQSTVEALDKNRTER